MANSNCTEAWRPVVGYEDWYSISDQGHVRRDGKGGGARIGRILRPNRRSGYFYVGLCKGHGRRIYAVHHLVLLAFVGSKPPKCEARHLNGCRTDNRVNNLAWGTHKQNGEDSTRYGGAPRGESHPHSKLTNNVVRQIRAKYTTGHYTRIALAVECGVSRRTVGRAISRELWTHVK